VELLSAADRPTAMFCMADSIAYGVCVACAELGLAIPSDVSVAGFGEHPMSRLLAPPLTSTAWDVERVAQVATGFLLDALEHEGPDAARRELFPPLLVPRASTGPPPA
jgi:DNA-binding LacI/PurR family transcriptional regulator